MKIKTLDDFAKVGSRFLYLGVPMLVRSTSTVSHGVSVTEERGLVCEYVDNSGIIQSKTFYPADLDCLIAEYMRCLLACIGKQ